MRQRIPRIMGLGLLVLWLLTAAAFAAQAEWRDQAYNFGSPKFILVMDPSFAYEGYDVSYRNKFNKYPYAAEKIMDMLRGRMNGLARHRIVGMDYVINQIKSDATLTEKVDPLSPGFGAILQREMGKHVDLVLSLDVRDYGWFYEYHDAYMTTETYTERVSYKKHNRDGSESWGWMDVPRTRIVHHPAGYYISDCAEASFRLQDAKTGRDVWKYSDSRNRRSPSISNGYDPSGPESMMKRIFDEAFKKIPLAY